MSLFVLRNAETGFYNQTGYSATENLQEALIYSSKGRYGHYLHPDYEGRVTIGGSVYEVIPVKVVAET